MRIAILVLWCAEKSTSLHHRAHRGHVGPAQETLTQLLSAIACPTGEPLQATEKVLQIMALTQSALPVDTMTRLLDWLES